MFADELLRQMGDGESTGGLTTDVIFTACRGLMARARGGYAALVLINGYGVLAFRDPWGIRPLCYGSRDAKQFLGTSGKDWCVASESVALECQDFDLHGDVLPGQALFISLSGEVSTQVCHASPQLSPCIFEYVYFGRPDSIIDGVSVYAARKAVRMCACARMRVCDAFESTDAYHDLTRPPSTRRQMGDKLAEKIRRQYDVSEIDVVVPVSLCFLCLFGIARPSRP